VGGGQPASHRQARQHAAQHAVADDQVGRHDRVRAPEARVVGRGGQRQQHAALAQRRRRFAGARAGTTSRDAAPPNRPRTGPKQRAPGTNTRSPTR
jgi:hypothetical protein